MECSDKMNRRGNLTGTSFVQEGPESVPKPQNIVSVKECALFGRIGAGAVAAERVRRSLSTPTNFLNVEEAPNRSSLCRA